MHAPPAEPVIELVEAAIASIHNPEAAEVKDINWEVRRGDFWVIGGLHGLGKSNLIATLAGLAHPLQGEIRMFGRDLAGLREDELLEERRRAGMVFGEGGRMLKHLTVSENVALPLRYHYNWSPEESEPRVKRILEVTGLTPMAHNTSGMISQNWQQRVGLARTLALGPEVLLLDKPLIGLKSNHRAWWLDFLTRLDRGIPELEMEPATLVATTDDFGLWTRRARQFAVIQGKAWTEIGGRDRLEAGDWMAERTGEPTAPS